MNCSLRLAYTLLHQQSAHTWQEKDSTISDTSDTISSITQTTPQKDEVMPSTTLTVNSIVTIGSSHTIYGHRHNADGQEVQLEVIVYRERPPGSVNYYDRNSSIEHVVLYGGTPDAYCAIVLWQVAVGNTHELQWDGRPLAPNRFPLLVYTNLSGDPQNPWNSIRCGSTPQKHKFLQFPEFEPSLEDNKSRMPGGPAMCLPAAGVSPEIEPAIEDYQRRMLECVERLANSVLPQMTKEIQASHQAIANLVDRLNRRPAPELRARGN